VGIKEDKAAIAVPPVYYVLVDAMLNELRLPHSGTAADKKVAFTRRRRQSDRPVIADGATDVEWVAGHAQYFTRKSTRA
jgi:hypothetical protein